MSTSIPYRDSMNKHDAKIKPVYYNCWQEAIKSLWQQKLRTLLVGCAITVAATVVFCLLGLYQQASHAVQQTLNQLAKPGLAVVSIQPKPYTQRPQLSLKDAKLKLTKLIPQSKWTGVINQYSNGQNGMNKIKFHHIISPINFQKLRQLSVTQGRLFHPLDMAQNRFCVIGQRIAEKVKQQQPHQWPYYLSIKGRIHTVIGILEPTNFIIGMPDINSSVITLIDEQQTNQNVLDYLLIDTSKSIEGKNITALISRIQKQYPEYQLQYHDARLLTQGLQQGLQKLQFLLICICIASLVIAGSSISNSLLASVLERRNEIGIRIALGAKPQDIRKIFLCETWIICLLSCIICVFLGSTLMILINGILKTPQLDINSILSTAAISSLITTGIATLAAAYPANKASKTLPIQLIKKST